MAFTPAEIQAIFDEDMVLFVRATVERAGLNPRDVEWLSTVGLPLKAAPFLSFGWREARGLPTVDEYFSMKAGIDPSYRVIGTNGSGDPIVVDVAEDGTVYYLNHDDGFRAFFINTSVRHLASCLAAYTQMISQAQTTNGADAYLDDKVPPETVHTFESQVREIDPAALQRGAMWADEVARLNGI